MSVLLVANSPAQASVDHHALPFDVKITFKLFPKNGTPEKANGFTIAKARRLSDGRIIQLKGGFGPVVAGETITIAKGEWRKDPKYGSYFNVDAISWKDPETAATIRPYLERIGIPPDLAREMVHRYGDETLKRLDEDKTAFDAFKTPDVDKMRAHFRKLRAEQIAMVQFAEWGLEERDGRRLYRYFGENVLEEMEKNPYAAMRAGIDFPTADMYAGEFDIAEEDPRRIAAACIFMTQEGEGEGEISLCEQEVAKLMRDRLDLAPDKQALATALASAAEDGDICKEYDALTGADRYYQPDMLRVETRLYAKLDQMLAASPRELDRVPTIPEGTMYTEEQWRAVENALCHRISVFTGGPGCGKTTSLKGLLDELDNRGETYTLLAPTARAAKRMEESTGRDAATIHRSLGMTGMATPETIRGEHVNEERRLTSDVVVMDETSMVDARMCERVLSHLGSHTRLVMVGDPDQLPPVRAGSVLLNLINEERTAVTSLSKPFRQAQGSLIVVNSHRIKAGKEPYWSAKEAEAALRVELDDPGFTVANDWEFHAVEDADAAIKKTLELSKSLPDELGVTDSDVLVASPSRQGACGVYALNAALQELWNPHGEQIREGEEPLRIGDRVMNTRNRYDGKTKDLLTANGDMGTLRDVQSDGSIDVDLIEGPLRFMPQHTENLTPAYCSTIHKLQGSEAPGLIAPIVARPESRMLSKNLLYTAWTRAQRKCVVIGKKDLVMQALKIDGTIRSANLDLRADRVNALVKDRTERYEPSGS